MTKQSPRILTLLLCCSFALASPVHGECAWVLWGQSVDPRNALVALPLGAWATRGQ